MSQVIFENVTYTFGNDCTALDHISCQINPGEFVFITGPSGSGKTTFLRLILKELQPQEGKIFIGNDDITAKRGPSLEEVRRKIGASFQDVKLLMDRTIEENIGMAMEIVGIRQEDINKAIDAVLDLVDLSDKRQMFPSQLSGGEIQRIGIARAVVGDPLIIFSDEPTANLDEESAWKITSLLREINKSGKTVIIATHNMDLVESMGERILQLDKGKLIKDKKAQKKAKKKKK
jgi:cell division transport system ATP-binding protein